LTSPAQKTLRFGLIALAVLAAALFVFLQHATPPPEPSENPGTPSSVAAAPHLEPPPPATVTQKASFDRTNLGAQFVGSRACAACHATQAAAYAKSHHARALAPATPENVLGKLDGTSFSTALGGNTRFVKKNGAYQATSPNGSGRFETFPIRYVTGVTPLQQYVVATERGKLQTLGVSWDSRAVKDGGERFFHVYGSRGIAPADELFFTKPAQNFNHVCADCHATFVERRYDPAADSFDTRFAEPTVGCEACHGPGAEHVRKAKTATGQRGAYANGLGVELERSAAWAPSATGSPTPRAPDQTEIEVCAPCHSRREPLHEGFVAGDPFLDSFEPELLRPGRYHADGQVEGEVYEWGSFLQSRMYAAGVRCSDCHEPHSGELFAEGNALCTRCHAPARFDTPSHSHHAGSGAPHCVDCHLPAATFMQIDVRRDHSIRIPRPDLSAEFGTPNACQGCHPQTTASDAARTLARWFPDSTPRPHFVNALAREREGALDAPRALEGLARDGTAPAIARATALERLGHFRSQQAVAVLQTALASAEPLVVYGAVLGVAELPLAERVPLLFSVLEHPRRLIRIAAGKALASVPLAELDARARAALEHAFAEVEQSFAVGASQPQTLVEKSSFELARGQSVAAQATLESALALAPCFAAARLNLADLARARGDEAGVEREIHAALACDPDNAFAHHALGLALVRRGDKKAALLSLARAVALAPAEARFAYVLAVADADLGDLAAAVRVLDAALERHPNDRNLLQALLEDTSKLDQLERARDARAKLDKLDAP
jgi:predicted CXXCH cytochrome family protein